MSGGTGNCDNAYPTIYSMVDCKCLIDDSKEVKETPIRYYNRVIKNDCSDNVSNFIHLNHHQDHYHI
jgi:hypothetical protein